MLDYDKTLAHNDNLRLQVEAELRRCGIGSWASECLAHRTLSYCEGGAILVLLAGVADGAFGPWNVRLDENGDPR